MRPPGRVCFGCTKPDPGTQPADDTSTVPASETGLPSACTTSPTTDPLPPQPDLAAIPPIVVRTVPANLDWEVDPALPAIEVTFSQDMNGGQSWVSIDEDLFPEYGEFTWVDGRTDRMEVTLDPDHTYVVLLNAYGAANFQSIDGIPALPHTLVFHTRAE